MSKDRRKKPRWLQKLLAQLGGYFWLPCPICGECFAGHEWSDDATLYDSDDGGIGVCDNCISEATRRSEEKRWKRRINQLADECTTDFGSIDLEMFAEKVLKLITDTE